MIKIKRADCPPSLQDPERISKNDYKNTDVKNSLFAMQHGKCSYCERSLEELPETEREVDHYMPKNSFKDEKNNIPWHIANAWVNLLYSCRTCNSRKHEKPPINKQTGDREIINPSDEGINPEDHIDFKFDHPIIAYKAKDDSPLGASTIEKLKLSERKDLFQRFRKNILEIELHFIDLINAVENGQNNSIESKKRELSMAMSSHIPFSCFKRNFIRQRLAQLNEKEIPKLEERYNKNFPRIEIHFPKGFEVIH
jgi:uncharacterized protein (TIGR02646 family)